MDYISLAHDKVLTGFFFFFKWLLPHL